MTDQVHEPRVQNVAIERLLNNAYETLNHQLLSISGRVVLWGSLSSKDDLRDRYLKKQGNKALLDRRHHQTADKKQDWVEIDNAAIDAWDYLQWAKTHGGQPIARESLVTYWSAFENCLKAIATAFFLANSKEATRTPDQIFVPLTALNGARRFVGKQWKERGRDGHKGRLFFDEAIVQKNPFPKNFVFAILDENIWCRIGSAYKARNAIIHSIGLATENFDFDEKSLYAGDEIEVTPKVLRILKEDF